jgi:hypothetical protein
MSNNFQDLKNKLILGSIGGCGVGALLLFTPIKPIANWVIAGSVGCVIAANLAIDESEKIAAAKVSTVQATADKLYRELGTVSQNLEAKNHELTNSTKLLQKLNQEIRTLQELFTKSKIQLLAVNNQLSEAKSCNSELAIEYLQESFENFRNSLAALINQLSKRYPDLRDWVKITDDYQDKVEEFTQQIRVVSDQSSTHDLIACALAVQHEVISTAASLKIRSYKAVLTHVQQQLHNSVSVAEYDSLNQEYQEKISQIKAEYQNYFEAVKQEFSQVADNFTLAYQQDFKEVVTEGLNQVETIEKLQLEINWLKQQIKELSKPYRFVGLSEQARVGNAIIDYYHRLGLILDAVDWLTNDTGYRLLFHTGRNKQLVTTELLNDADNCEKLKEVSAAINSPKFELGDRSTFIYLEVQTRHRQKTSESDINRLWRRADKFPQIVRDWSRIRLTGGSESGKSPTAENLAVCILQNRQGIAKLFNPQFDSIKNYWTIPTVGTSHSESESAIHQLAKKVNLRSQGKESRELFELWLFDEIDSTMSNSSSKRDIGDSVNFIIKQASHQNLGAIFIGQNANVNEYPGMSRSDWNSAVNVHIGANAYDAITNSNKFTNEEVNKLKSIADKLTEYCDSKNDELGLDKTHPNAFRFALVLEPSKKPYFIELPTFGCYSYDKINVVNIHKSITAQPSQTSTDENLEPLKNQGVMATCDTAIQPVCVSCGSSQITKNGKVGSKQRYKCKDCKKTWIKE